MQEEWRTLEAYPRYGVSNFGDIRNLETERPVVPSKNQQGHLKVNLFDEGRHYTRSIAHLVADAFLPPPERNDFISLIHYDGNKMNCRADNLAWRPRHFVLNYHKQFHDPWFQSSSSPVIDIGTGRLYETAQEAALEHGLLFKEVMFSAQNRGYVWPTYQRFRFKEAS